MTKSYQQRLDGFMNVLTGLGGSKDKRLAAQFVAGYQLDEQVLEDLYNNNDLAHKIVSVYPEEGLRQGYEITIGKDEEGKKEADLVAELDDLDVNSKVLEAACWGRLYGGGALFLGIDQGKPDQPLEDEGGGELEFLTVLDKTELTVERYYTDPFQDKFGRPEIYRYTPTATQGATAVNTLIHETRLILFPGAHTTKRQKQRNNGWDNSVLQALYDVIRDFEAGFAGAGYLLSEASQGIFKVKGLLEILAGEGGQETLSKRMEIVDMSRSVARSLLVDADGEDFERKPTTFSGIPDILDRLCSRLAAATGIPVTILMGQAPAGLQATGASDIRAFYDRIKSYQKDVLKPALERIIKIVLISQGGEPEHWDLEFCSLYQPTELETAQLRQVVAATDVAYITAGVVTPEEVAMSRFTPDGWSMETQIDLDLRAEVDEINANKALEQAKNPETMAGDPATLTPEREKPEVPKKDAFDPDQPRDENGRWGASGAGPSSKEKWAKARAYVAAKKAKQEAHRVTGATPVKPDLSGPTIPDSTAVELAQSSPFPKEGYEDVAFISDVYDTAVKQGFSGSIDDFKAKLPHGILSRADIVSALDEEKVRRSETNVQIGKLGSVQKHFVRRKLDANVAPDSDGVGTTDQPSQVDTDEAGTD